ncbi:hypothetical protein [Alkalihalobacillus sp. CinArs1]|uniref:hypothetical protein n=1 Tax=Alkalihalobacillus sp. CinArs1 TaxID=2995314 RepID=UPI0022DE245F|nr:hypothetical protein [Alkalihalobacillus sp. CinArs1]
MENKRFVLIRDKSLYVILFSKTKLTTNQACEQVWLKHRRAKVRLTFASSHQPAIPANSREKRLIR